MSGKARTRGSADRSATPATAAPSSQAPFRALPPGPFAADAVRALADAANGARFVLHCKYDGAKGRRRRLDEALAAGDEGAMAELGDPCGDMEILGETLADLQAAITEVYAPEPPPPICSGCSPLYPFETDEKPRERPKGGYKVVAAPTFVEGYADLTGRDVKTTRAVLRERGVALHLEAVDAEARPDHADPSQPNPGPKGPPNPRSVS